MKWKQLIEDKIKHDVFIDRFDNEDKVMEYIYQYFENFFNVDGADEYIQLDKSDGKITLKVYSHQIEVKSGPSIKFRYCETPDGIESLLGQLYVPEMRFTHSGNSKTESFSDDLLNHLLEKAFKGLAKNSGMQVLK